MGNLSLLKITLLTKNDRFVYKNYIERKIPFYEDAIQ